MEKEEQSREEDGKAISGAILAAVISIVLLVAALMAANRLMEFFRPTSPLMDLALLTIAMVAWALGTTVATILLLPAVRHFRDKRIR